MQELVGDLNTTIANLAVSFAGKARVYRQKEAAATGSLADPSGNYSAEAFRYEAKQAGLKAALWEARAETAKTGFMLASEAEYTDHEFMGEYQNVLVAFQKASRVVYRADVADQEFRQSEAGAPKV